MLGLHSVFFFHVGPPLDAKWVKNVTGIHHWIPWNKEQAVVKIRVIRDEMVPGSLTVYMYVVLGQTDDRHG